jgi:hypothetical protein
MRPTLSDGSGKRRWLTRAIDVVRRAGKSGVMLRACFITAICILAVTGVAAAQAPGDVLKIVSVSPDQASGALSVDLLNVGDRMITAFQLAVAGNRANTVGEEFFWSIGLASLNSDNAGVISGSYFGGIPPGRTRRFNIAGAAKGSPTVEVAALIFEDDSAIGDEVQIARLFTERKAEAAEMGKWCASMRSAEFQAAQHADPSSALSALAEQVRAAQVNETDPRRNFAAQHVRQEFASLLAQGSVPEAAAKPIGFLLDRCSSAALHSVRKVGPK